MPVVNDQPLAYGDLTMKRCPHVAILLVAVALVAADDAKKKKKDAEAIQGKWTIVESFHKGKIDDDPVGDVVLFADKKLIVSPKGTDKKIEFTFKLRPDKKPREIDMTMKFGGEEMTMKAIYELSGDTLKICIAEPGKERPEALGTAADDKRKLMVLKRVKPDKKKNSDKNKK